MKIKVKKLSPNAVIPSYANPGDAGLDLTAVSKEVVNLKDWGYIEYDTGLAVEIPEEYVGLVFPRSSISKTGMILSNAVAVIDSGYRGSIKLRFKWIPDTKAYEVGEKIAQLIILPIPYIQLEEHEQLSETVRGSSGFGSSSERTV